MTGPARAAVDIGGTFTDIVVESDRGRTTAKVLTTYPNPEEGFVHGLQVALERASHRMADLSAIVHGTTLATNALITRRGARTALLSTAGFRDVIEIGHEGRFSLYDLFIEKPEPLVPRPLRFEVAERIAADGECLMPLDERALRELAPAIRAAGTESLAICFLQSWANPTHEELAEAILVPLLPGVTITRSADVCGEIREYDRFSTATANAYVRPQIQRYLDGLSAQLHRLGAHCPLLIVTSGGGMTTPDLATRYPIRLVESGPAGGAVLASDLARSNEFAHALSFDMGGTTAKICFIEHGKPKHARSFEAARAHRFARGSGLPLRIPVVEMVEIGAGGGSIAGIDRLGRVIVGPESAASVPGPACYSRGGTKPTVTDADLLTGRIDADRFAGGSVRLDAAAARRALEPIATRLQLESGVAAAAISEVVEETMAAAARVHAAEIGQDTASCVMIAFGGAAPLHAARVAEKLEISRVVIPKDAGVGSAIGFLSAPVSFELALSYPVVLSNIDVATVNARLDALAMQARTAVMSVTQEPLVEERAALMRYRGQGHEIEVPLPPGRLVDADTPAIRQAFIEVYRRLYGLDIPQLEVEVMTWLVSARAVIPRPVATDPDRRLSEGPVLSTLCPYADPISGETHMMRVVDRVRLPLGWLLEGPAAVREDETTTFVPAGWNVASDLAGSLILTRNSS